MLDRRINRATELLDSFDGNGKLTRAGFLAGAGAGVAGLIAGCGSSKRPTSTLANSVGPAPKSGQATPTYVKGGELNIYTWPEYFAPEATKEWQAKTGAKLNTATYEGNAEMFAKLNTAAGSDYDMAIPTSGWVPELASRGLIQKLDRDRIPWQYVRRDLLGQKFDPDNLYSVPKDYGTSVVVYDPAATGGEIETWQDFIDAAKKPGVSGKVAVSDEPISLFGIGLWILGYSWYTEDIGEWKKAAEYIQHELVPHVKVFGGTFEQTAYADGSLAMGLSDSSVARRVRLQNPKIKFALLKPHSELWVDNFTITADARNLDAAYSYIEFMLQPEIQQKETEYIGYATGLPGLEQKLKNFKYPESVFPTPEQFEYLEVSIVQPKIQDELNRLYTQVKASS